MGTLYERLDFLCKERGIKGGRMCGDLGISKSLMTDLKSGRKKGVSAETAQKIANYFNVTVGYLLGEEELPKNAENPTIPVVGGGALNNAGYYELSEENRKLIDQMIDKLLKAQSGE